MPFTTTEARLETLESPSKALTVPGNRAWIIYREFKRQWHLAPRWTTADILHESFVMNPEDNKFMDELHCKAPLAGWNELCNAAHLAWQVFFLEVVMPYEMQKKAENGDVV